MTTQPHAGRAGTTPDGSEIVHHQGGTTFAGPDAVNLVRATYLVSALRMYAKSRMLMTRGATPTHMLRLAGQYTGKTYKRGEHLQAADDVAKWADTMRAALPVRDERGGA